MPYSLKEINEAIRTDPKGFAEACDAAFAKKVETAAQKIADHRKESRIILLSGPSGSGKTTTALKIEEQLEKMGIQTHTISMDNYFNTIDPETAPRNREGAIDYESPFCLDIELLNRVQLGKPLSDEEIARLRSKRLIEGRKPKIYIAKHIAQKVGQKIEYSEHKGLGNKRCEEFLLTALRDHKSLSRREIDKLLWNLLSNLLDDRQKKDKITNLLAKLKRQGKIRNESQGPNSDWFIV